MKTPGKKLIAQFLILLALVSLANIIPTVAAQQTAVSQGAVTPNSDLIGLPGGCIRVIPGDETRPSCCINGYVWMDGQIVHGATVTISTSDNQHSQTVITDLFPDSTQPYYHLSLSGHPLNVEAGQTINITAQYSGHERTITHVVQPGGQQVDVVLSRNQPQDYIFQQQIWSPAEQEKFNSPTGIATDSAGNVYVLDSFNARIQVFDRNGQFLRKWGKIGNLPGEFGVPFAFSGLSGLALDSSDDVYVADTNNHRIQKFSSTGDLIAVWGGYGSAPGQLIEPSGIAVDSNGVSYVVDAGNHRIQKFTSDGRFLAAWGRLGGGAGEFSHLGGIAIDHSGFVYVADAGNNRIQKFTSDGTFVSSWGTFGSGAGQFSNPTGLAVDANGSVYVADRWNERIQKFTSNGTFMTMWGVRGDAPGEFDYPVGITVSNDGSVYTTEWNNQRVQKFTANGNFITKWGSYGNANGQLGNPYNVATDSEGYIYVADTDNHRIQKFTSDGAFVTKWGGFGSEPGVFRRPTGIVIDQHDNIYVIDQLNHRVQKFTDNGTLITRWGTEGSDDGQFQDPTAIAVDGSGSVYVADTDNHRVQKFTSNGTFITKWGSEGSTEGQFLRPAGIAIDGSGSVYVADTDNHRIQKFTSDGAFVTKWGSEGRESGQFLLPAGMAVDRSGSVYVADTDNHRIQKFTSTGGWVASWSTFGSGVGQLFYPHGVNVDDDGRVYVADTFNDRVQVFHEMNYTRPVATITWLNHRSISQDQDTLVLHGRSFDSDEDGDATGFTYRWYRENILIGTGSTLMIPASSLPNGTYTISLEVTDDEGEVSPRVSTPIDVGLPDQTAWTFMLYLVADSYPDGTDLLDFMGQISEQGLLARLKHTPNSNVKVVVQIDAYNADTRRLVLEQNQGRWEFREIWHAERAMDDPATLEDFVRWTKQNHPARHYYLAIASHGNGYQGVAWDSTSGQNAYLTMAEIGTALERASGSGAAPIDVLHLDACSMGMLDVAYELRNNVQYLVFSQNLGWSFFLQDRYLQQTRADTSPEQLGSIIVTTYAQYADHQSISVTYQYPYTISLLDLRHVETTAQLLDKLSRELAAFAASNGLNRDLLADVRRESQKFDSPDFDFTLDNLDEYVDLVDWSNRVQSRTITSDPAVAQSAKNLRDHVEGPLMVLDADSEARYRMPNYYGGAYTDLTRAHGVSLYYPHESSKSVPTVIWYNYKTGSLFNLPVDTMWDEFMRSSNIALPSPPDPLPEPGRPQIVFSMPLTRAFIPITTR